MVAPLIPPLPRPALPTPPRRPAPAVATVGVGISVVKVGDVIRIDVESDEGTERVTRFVTIQEARQLNVLLARLSI